MNYNDIINYCFTDDKNGKLCVILQNKKIISASKKVGEDIIVKASKYELINF